MASWTGSSHERRRPTRGLYTVSTSGAHSSFRRRHRGPEGGEGGSDPPFNPHLEGDHHTPGDAGGLKGQDTTEKAACSP